ncbi:uncharacterized protein LOC128171589 [Crassostrea angulata]|uniref:uncharacterized protein LOC128171589 n=1 Tax=Magallana angulata TaxID=2784310 RepID=UPI0022B15163|nr:uncharacterized protein LOC128171589 [Crassostrea angulata]
MKKIPFKPKLLTITSFLAVCVGVYILGVAYSLFREPMNNHSLFIVLNQRDDTPDQCENVNLMYYDEEQNNENIKDLKECKGSDKNFEKVLRKNMQKVDNYLFNDSNKLLKRLQLDREGIIKLSTPRRSKELLPIFVTALSDNHFQEFIQLINSLKIYQETKHPQLMIFVYDIGLSKENSKLVRQMCNCKVRAFPFNTFPKHVKNVLGYTWKPIIIQMMLQEFDFVMWLDTSVRLENTDPYFVKAKCLGIQVLEGSGSIAVRTQKRLFERFKEDQCMFNYPEIQAGMVIISRTYFTLNYIMRPWVGCALEYGCMDFPNAEVYRNCTKRWIPSDCHRFDQSTLGVIMTRLFNKRRHHFVVKEDFAKVLRHETESSQSQNIS